MNKYIITDPCYIMDTAQYDAICEKENCDFEGQKFPLVSKHRETGKPIKFFRIEQTPNGDGSREYWGNIISVDAGMLCIAWNAAGWNEALGATFDTLADAKRAFPSIIKRF